MSDKELREAAQAAFRDLHIRLGHVGRFEDCGRTQCPTRRAALASPDPSPAALEDAYTSGLLDGEGSIREKFDLVPKVASPDPSPERERRLEFADVAVSRLRDALVARRDDMRWCTKEDNCRDGAEWIELAISDVDAVYETWLRAASGEPSTPEEPR